MNQPLISVRNVRKVWNENSPKALTAIDALSFDVAPGEFVVLLGPSGCGKSSLLYMLAGLETPTDGELLFDGMPIEGPDTERGMIFQEASLYPWLTIAENVAFGLKLRGELPEKRERIARELLLKVGLADAVHKRPEELSGGMRQRAALARALSMRPKVMMMDEPFAALDIQTRAKMQDHLLKIWRDSRAGVVMVTHSIEEAVALADRIVVWTARPGRVKEIVSVDMPRPRNPRDPAFIELQLRLGDLLADEVDRAFREMEASI
ncbi:ABC transporter ATP-binding protein [Verticiella sediminum]|uniref:ABC transporter ATP-binding protein n=1 Tax=Verticiella sediminum TaxID=1247510 RepID=A0A556ARI8_9BURK|nr:ABC transporter ATP-binding protein [Verticiella sediminum]TSH95547.1 ABC transporter ATP-binding protein [Verticiella sediminum]